MPSFTCSASLRARLPDVKSPLEKEEIKSVPMRKKPVLRPTP
jgi:hypothetical protein